MRGMSPLCIRLTSRSLDRVPAECGRDGEPTRWFIQEMLWALWLEVADSILGGAPLPPEVLVRVGRSHLSLPVSEDDWASFQEEIDCVRTEVRDHVGRLLAAQLMGIRTGPAGRVDPLSAELASLVILLCDLDQRERRRHNRDLRIDSDLADIVSRHPTPAAFGPSHLLPSATVLIEYAGLQQSSRGHGPLRSAYFSAYRPLRRRIEGRQWSPPAASPPDLTLDFLRQALKDGRPALVTDLGISSPNPPALLPVAATDTQIGLGALVSLLAPVLQTNGDPLETAFAAPAELGRRLCAAVADVLQTGSIEWYGRPGDRVIVGLPHAEWRLDNRAAVPSDPASPRPYHVTRWGLRLYGRIISPALITPDLEAPR